MSQAAELSRAKGRIKALIEKTVANGCTEAEAMAATAATRARCLSISDSVGHARQSDPLFACDPDTVSAELTA